MSDLLWLYFWSWLGASFSFWVSGECAGPPSWAPLAPGGAVAMCCLPHVVQPYLAECSEHTDTGLPP